MDIPLMRTITRILETREVESKSSLTRANTDSTVNSSSDILSGDDFLKLLLAQLRYQDPLNSLSTEEFTSQLVQFSTLDSVLQQSESLDQLLDKVLRMEAIGFLGKKVRIDDKIGIVSKVTFENGTPKVWIDGESYDISLISEVISDG
ncbi:TPA: hypothetical protein GXX44_09175 [bacterium]|jgi:flagellar basal-body rod modification protein FlgD|nr:hypothetical protein [bacterium]